MGVACSGPNADKSVSIKDLNLAPQDFALLPCGGRDDVCAVLHAGGKRLLFGAPADATAAIEPDDLSRLDAVFVFSLRGEDLEGLDTVRNSSWRLGRQQVLPVIGPVGIETVSAALNLTFEQADALFVVENGLPAGGYDAALLVARPIDDPAEYLFDTGDLRVRFENGEYVITYNHEDLLALSGCGQPRLEEFESRPELTRISCVPDAEGGVWPLAEPLIIRENNKGAK